MSQWKQPLGIGVAGALTACAISGIAVFNQRQVQAPTRITVTVFVSQVQQEFDAVLQQPLTLASYSTAQPVAGQVRPVWVTPAKLQLMHTIKSDSHQLWCVRYLTYAEARGEGEVGAKEVVLDTINRIENGHFGGNTACEVAYAVGQYDGVKKPFGRWRPKEKDSYATVVRWVDEVLDGNYVPPPDFGSPDEYWYMRPEKASLVGKCNQFESTFLVGYINHHRFGRKIHTEAERQEVLASTPSECKAGHARVALAHRTHRVVQKKEPTLREKIAGLFNSSAASKTPAKKKARVASK